MSNYIGKRSENCVDLRQEGSYWNRYSQMIENTKTIVNGSRS
jgi:hypothetical protein